MLTFRICKDKLLEVDLHHRSRKFTLWTIKNFVINYFLINDKKREQSYLQDSVL